MAEMRSLMHVVLFFFSDAGATEVYTLSLHDALPIFVVIPPVAVAPQTPAAAPASANVSEDMAADHTRHVITSKLANRSEEHTSELQSQSKLVCRLLLEKKNPPPDSTTSRYLPQTAPA